MFVIVITAFSYFQIIRGVQTKLPTTYNIVFGVVSQTYSQQIKVSCSMHNDSFVIVANEIHGKVMYIFTLFQTHLMELSNVLQSFSTSLYLVLGFFTKIRPGVVSRQHTEGLHSCVKSFHSIFSLRYSYFLTRSVGNPPVCFSVKFIFLVQ